MTSARLKKRIRLPVISRLTLAWSAAAFLLTALSATFIYSVFGNSGIGRIALPVDNIEHLASATIATTSNADPIEPTSSGLRLGAPKLREGENDGPQDNAIEGIEGEDYLLYPDENFAVSIDANDVDVDDAPISADDIIITIPGSRDTASSATLASIGRGDAATPIPNPPSDMQEKTPLGNIPRITPDGRTAMSLFAREHSNSRGEPRVAIIVGGLGLNPALTEKAIDDLPADVSLAFAPYAKDLEFWTQKARQAGHEVLIELPMESYGGNQETLGAAALLSSRSAKENLQRMDWLMSRFGGYFAATNYLGGKFSADAAAMAPILEKLRSAGVAYIDDTGAARTLESANRSALATVNRIIPPAPSDDARLAVRSELAALEKIAARDGIALGKTYAYAISIEELSNWAIDLREKGIAMAPASAALPTHPSLR